jgi:hypothetical protein
LLEWIILGAIAGSLAVAFWDQIKDWIRNISYKLKRTSKMFIEKLTGNKHKIIVEGETMVVEASDVPEEIRRKAKYIPVDITAEAKRAGILQI